MVSSQVTLITSPCSSPRQPRPGCRDIWNASMVDGAHFGKHDIPFYPTTADHIPENR